MLLESAGSEPQRRRADLDRLDGLCHRLEIDTEPTARVTDHRPRSTMLAASHFAASMVIAVGLDRGSWAEATGLHERAPVAIVQGALELPLSAIACVCSRPADAEVGAVLRRDDRGDAHRREHD
jgi:hypothetical protein